MFNLIKSKRSGNSKIRNKLIQKIRSTKKTNLISDVGRSINDGDGNFKSLYFDTILKTLGKEKAFSVVDKDVPFDHDFKVNDINAGFIYDSLDQKEIILRAQVLDTFKKIKGSGIFTEAELINIKYAFHKFFHQYKIWNRFLNEQNAITKCYFVCHYHKEGQILALKEHSIECIELQHGLIAPQDIFYVFPKSISVIKDRALFADKIYTFGSFWNDVLLEGGEYNKDQIGIIGYYLFNDFGKYKDESGSLKKMIGEKTSILITTQTHIHSYFIAFVKKMIQLLGDRKKEFIVLLKPHPAEDINLYKNAFSSDEDVHVLQYPVPVLFENTDIHISVYSTTLYEALRYNIPNLVFKAPRCEDYVDEILRSGIAKEIVLPDDILNFNKDSNKKNVTNYFYEPYNKNLLN